MENDRVLQIQVQHAEDDNEINLNNLDEVEEDQDNHEAINRRTGEAPKVNGNFISVLDGLIVFGPKIINFSICLIVYLVVGIIFVSQIPEVYHGLGKTIGNFGLVLYFLTMLFFIWTCTTDPGAIPKSWTLNQYNSLNPKSSDEEGFRKHFCHKCNSTRPPRSYHCKTCGVCIRRHDMHLLFGGTCIGQRNFLQYFFLNLCEVIFGLYLISVNTYSIIQPNQGQTMLDLSRNILLLLFGLLLLACPQTGLCMLIYRLILVSHNKTLREEFRILKGYDSFILLRRFGVDRHKFGLKGWSVFFCPKPRAKSIFSENSRRASGRFLSYVSWEDFLSVTQSTQFSQGRNRSVHPEVDWNNNSGFPMPYVPLTDMYVRSAHRNVETTERDYVSHLKETSKAKLKNVQSLPLIEEGDLHLFPGTRLQPSLKEKPTKSLQNKIKLFKQIQQLPKSIVDFRMSHTVPSTLSDGAIPRSERTPSSENELVQLARASQIQEVIQLCLQRDRRGLIELARRINLGLLIGIPDLDPDNLQILELRNNGGFPIIAYSLRISTFEDLLRRQERIERNQQIRANPATRWLAPQQMIAAGLLRQDENHTLRRITGQIP